MGVGTQAGTEACPSGIHATQQLVAAAAYQFHFHSATLGFFTNPALGLYEGETPDSLRPLSHAPHTPPLMSQAQQLGTCPHCDAAIATSDVLIEYTRSGTSTQYAECPHCESVVRPD